MTKISQADYRKMKNAYRHDLAIYLANAATEGRLVTYGEIAKDFGGTARSWGNALGGIAIRFKEAKLPLLPVIVVNAGTGQPSVDAVLYEDLGLKDREAIAEEQKLCFRHDWRGSPLLASR